MNKTGLISVIVHGGAGLIPDSEGREYLDATARAVSRARDILLSGGNALAAAVEAVIVMEEAPFLNAGYGSVLDADGRLSFDASVMEGRGMNAGAIAAIPAVIRNPVLLAKLVMEKHPSVLLAGDGALDFARAEGVPFIAPESMITERQRERWQRWQVKAAERAGEPSDDSGLPLSPGHPEAEDYNSYDALVGSDPAGKRSVAPMTEPSGNLPGESPRNSSEDSGLFNGPGDTVGAVVRDGNGWIVSAMSTGGVRGKPRGRIGDTPLVGCGLYADDRAGGAAATGIGEHIIRSVLCARAIFALESMNAVHERNEPGCLSREHNAQLAAESTCRFMLDSISGNAGIVLLDSLGNVGYAHTTPRMAVSYWQNGIQEPKSDLDGRRIT